MTALRRFLGNHRRLAALLLALALCMKVLVPAGFMFSGAGGSLALVVCPDAGGDPLSGQAAHHHRGPAVQGGMHVHAMHAVVAEHATAAHAHAKGDGVCPYSAVAMASLASVDAPLLALALVFILALGFTAAPPLRARGRAHLRPPLRGPPLLPTT
ncbi:MAG: hypothetical protein JF593_01305 [Novosphingobium sp.]|nr:hypothetical protein [Novosphingobium sp.]